MCRDKLFSDEGKVICDIHVMLLLIWMIACSINNNIANGRVASWGFLYDRSLSNAILSTAVYFFGRILFSIQFQWCKVGVYMLLCSVALKELIFCTFQYIHGSHELTGSLGNSGLLGGMIAICLSVFGSCIVKDGRYIRFLFLLPLFCLEMKTFSRAAWLSLAVVVFATCFRREKYKAFITKWKILLLLLTLGVFILVYYIKKESADSRLFMAMVILRNWHMVRALGVGPGNYCGFYGRSLFELFLNKESGIADSSIECVESLTKIRIGADIPDFAYNEILRAYVETGFVGAAIIVSVTILSFCRLYKRNDSLSYGFMALIVFSQFSYPSSVPLFCCMNAILMAAGASTPGNGESGKIKPYLILCSLLSVVVLLCFSNKRNTDMINRELICFNDSYKLGFYDDAVHVGASLYSMGYASPSFLLQYGKALSLIHEYEEGNLIINHGLEKSANPAFWALLGDNSVMKGDYLLAEKQYLHSFIMMPNRMKPLHDLASLYSITDNTLKLSVISDCALRMIPKIENEKSKRLREEILEMDKTK